MAKLICDAISSLDGYIEDSDGKFDWAAPDEEVHALVNDLMRPVGTFLLGRRAGRSSRTRSGSKARRVSTSARRRPSSQPTTRCTR